MGRLALAILIAAVSCASAFAEPLARDSAKKATVKLESCSLETQSALFYARMRRVPNAERMKLRFTLLERAGGTEWQKVDAPELAHWRKSEPGVRRFGYHQEVKGLTEGLAYRASVRYRWYDADGEVIKRARRRSRICRQYAALPNLRLQALGGQRIKLASLWRYDFRVRNRGAAPAAHVPVQLVVDGAVIDSVTVPALAPGEARVVRLRGPACHSGYEGVVDPESAIAESDESDNRALAPC